MKVVRKKKKLEGVLKKNKEKYNKKSNIKLILCVECVEQCEAKN